MHTHCTDADRRDAAVAAHTCVHGSPASLRARDGEQGTRDKGRRTTAAELILDWRPPAVLRSRRPAGPLPPGTHALSLLRLRLRLPSLEVLPARSLGCGSRPADSQLDIDIGFGFAADFKLGGLKRARRCGRM
ncbi:hypothetical protein GSI_00028 [Ganoderma sinense ZZ0214-1]|uniref:Uncharacterized protein n=1 Tax=Ganoderma sinense ZZ0214-1 TaxID=1077348 RepID=A0A2G8SRF4_9APHY|nr:hypothetical protein GSI_00028 [Ganoderma sinense ZZ0214-1]